MSFFIIYTELFVVGNIENNLLTSDKVTMVVNSCDAYQDILPLFFCALDEYWPNRAFGVVINSESEVEKVKNSKLCLNYVGKRNGNEWGLRLLRTLASIETEYVIMVFDDYVLESIVDISQVNSIISFMDDHSYAAVYYLNAVCVKSHVDDENSSYRLLKDRVDYRLNSAPAVWRRKDLMNYIGIGDNPWAWEVFGSYRTFGDGKDFYSPSSIENNIYNYQYKKGGAIYRGKWVSDVVLPKNKKYNLNIDFNQRGFSDNNSFEKRKLSWKVNFMWLGFRMVGFKVFYFIIRSLKAKIDAL